MELLQGHGKENLAADSFDGTYEPFGYMTVRNSATGEQLGRVDGRDELVGSATLVELNDDGVLDVVIGGRNGELMAVSGSDTSLLWQFYPEGGAVEDGWYNFYTPQPIGDVNDDAVPDLLTANGGDASRFPGDPDRPPGHLMVISGADGTIVSAVETPDGAETYMSPVVYRPTPEADLQVLFGTGGETLPGSLWQVPVADVVAGDLTAALELVPPTDANKGIIAPPSVGDLNQDGVQDIVAVAFDGRLIAFDGTSMEEMWALTYADHESIASPALGFFDDNPGLDVALLVLEGTFPRYNNATHLLVRGDTGQKIFEQNLAGIRAAGSPLAVDLTGDGRDEVIWLLFSLQGKTLVAILDPVRQSELHRAWLRDGFSISTPLVADLEGDGRLELITSVNLPTIEFSWGMQRLDLKANTPERISWGAYLGSTFNSVWEP
ncbi:MAG: hypothetical protein AAFX99_28120 [Myxococcota bacterium]